MAARASTDGGGLSMLEAEATASSGDSKGLKSTLGIGRSASKSGSGGSMLRKMKR